LKNSPLLAESRQSHLIGGVAAPGFFPSRNHHDRHRCGCIASDNHLADAATSFAYASTRAQQINKRWRTREPTLHVLELARAAGREATGATNVSTQVEQDLVPRRAWLAVPLNLVAFVLYAGLVSFPLSLGLHRAENGAATLCLDAVSFKRVVTCAEAIRRAFTVRHLDAVAQTEHHEPDCT
jgi:hypothetical protein